MPQLMKTIYTYLSIAILLLTACAKDANSPEFSNGGGGKGGSLAKFAIEGNYLYVVNSATLQVYDIMNNGAPVLKDSTNVGWNIETIFAYNQKLFIGSSDAMYIYNLDNPAKPQRESAVGHFRSCDPVVTQGNTSYVTLRGGRTCGGNISALLVYDVTNIKYPLQKNSIPLESPYGLGVQDSALYVCNGSNGLVVFDIKNAETPRELTRITGDNKYIDVIPYNGVLIAYVEGGIRFFDISEPQKPVLLSDLKN